MTIFKHAIKRLVGSKLKLFIMLAAPVLFALMFVMQSKLAVSIAVVDNDHSTLSQKLITSMESISGIKVTVLDDKALDDKIISYQASYSIIIPEKFEQTLVAGSNPVIGEFYLLEKEKLFYVRAFINNYIADMKALAATAGHDREAFGRAYAAYADGKLALANESISQDKIPQARGAMGFLVQFMLYMSVITAGLILEDRSSGVYYRVFFAPVSRRRYFTENLLAFLAIGALQVVFVLTFLHLVFGVSLGNYPLASYVLFTAFALVCISFGMWLITLFKKPLLAYLSIVFLVTPLVMLGGCYWPSSYMPDILIKISKFMPTTWVMQGVDKVLSDGASLGGIGLELLILLLFAGIFMAAGLVKKVDISK